MIVIGMSLLVLVIGIVIVIGIVDLDSSYQSSKWEDELKAQIAISKETGLQYLDSALESSPNDAFLLCHRAGLLSRINEFSDSIDAIFPCWEYCDDERATAEVGVTWIDEVTLC